MDRILVISDIHGCLSQFNALLAKANYQPSKDKLILLGDYVDRGPHSKEVVEKVMQMVNEENAIALRGNHDQRFLELIETRSQDVYDLFIKYGGLETLKSYFPNAENESINDILDNIARKYSDHIEFLIKTQFYHEEEHFIFVHAGINPKINGLENQSQMDLLNIRDPFINNENNFEKTVVFGHTRTCDIHKSNDIWFSKNKIGIDGGCIYGSQLNCLEIINNNTFKQYHVT